MLSDKIMLSADNMLPDKILSDNIILSADNMMLSDNILSVDNISADNMMLSDNILSADKMMISYYMAFSDYKPSPFFISKLHTLYYISATDATVFQFSDNLF
jgi:hypothetical protein